DLYRKYKPFAPLLSLPDRKMASLEKLLSLPEREFSSGKECISIYREYVKQFALRLALKEDWSAEKDSCSPALFGHNREDLLGLSGVTSLLSLFQLSEDRGDFLSASVTEAEKRQLCLVFSYALPFPALAFVRFPGGSFSLSGHEAAFCFDICEKGLPLYYTNYKEYDYIPTEDTAMPKSLSRFLDKSLRVSCKPENCRTWFPCSDDFLSSPEKIGEFLRHFFRYLFS
ncbi:MAG: hypothetical protein IIY55_02630, partial [Blautia sp.]|nr:hypothetical protein [Blautia sp.]